MQRFFFLSIVSILLGALLSSFGSTGKVELEIIGLESNLGKVYVNVFNGAEGFPEDKTLAFKSLVFSIENRTVRAEFDLPPGDYAIGVFHDVNNNDKVDTNFIGIPKEPLGSSSYQKKGRPNYENSKFVVLEGETINLSIAVSRIF